MLTFNDSRCSNKYTSITLTTSNITKLKNPVFDQITKIYSITPSNPILGQDYEFTIITTSKGKFLDMNG